MSLFHYIIILHLCFHGPQFVVVYIICVRNRYFAYYRNKQLLLLLLLVSFVKASKRCTCRSDHVVRPNK